MSAAVRPRSLRRHAAERPGQSGRPRDGAEDAGREAHADELGERSDEGVQRRRDPEQQRRGDRHPPRPEAVGEVSRRHGGEQHGRAVGAHDDARLRLAQVQRLLPARQQRRDREPEHEIEKDERADERREPARPPALHCRGRHGLGQGRRQSIGSAPCSASMAFARENGFEPKNPLCAESGLGCALSMQGWGVSSGLSVRASRPQRIGYERLVTHRQGPDSLLRDGLPALPAVGAGVARRDREDAVEEKDALPCPGREVAVLRVREAEVVAVLLEDVAEAAGERPYVGGDAEAQAHRMAGRRVRVLADDQDADVVQRLLQGREDAGRVGEERRGWRLVRP